MKAIQINRFGGPEVLEYVEMATPEPGPGQVRVRIRAIGVNFADTLARGDRYAATPELPAILGSEAAGVVEALGEGVDASFVGRRVAVPVFAGPVGFGAYAEAVIADVNLLVELPDEVSFEQAASVMNQGLTAYFLVRLAPPTDKTVLINAAAGGVGSYLVQMTKRAGARQIIAAASSTDKLDFARSIGADVGVNYTQPDWVERLRDVTDGRGPELIYESAGGSVTVDSLQALASLGQIVIYGALNIQDFQLGVPELLGLIFKNQSVTGFAFTPLLTPQILKEALLDLFDMLIRGEIIANVGGTYPLREAALAHSDIEARTTTGKLILIP